MRLIVIYKSRTGFTERYAKWIAEELDCETSEYENIRNVDLSCYDLIIYGGRVHAGKIDNLDAMKKRLEKAGRKLIVYATGATPLEAKEEVERVMHSNFGDNSIPHFYMPSGLCYEKMGWADRTIMKALSKMLSNKSGRSEAENGAAAAISGSYDICDKSFIQPLIGHVKSVQRKPQAVRNPMNDIAIRSIEKDRFDEALSLVWGVFQEYEAPDYTQEGVDEFFRSIHDEKYLSMLTVLGAFLNEQLVGIIATRSEGTHIALFFVDGKHHRQGIGKKLFHKVLECNDTKRLTVNSSPYAVPVYHKLGFVDTGREQTVSGLRFTPMIYDVI